MKYRLRLTFSTIKSKIQIQILPDTTHRNKFHNFSPASLDSSVECFTFSLRMTTTTFDGTPEILTLCSEWHRDVYILLVPKVLFGNVLKSETQFRTKQSFYDKCVPKQSLGTREQSFYDKCVPKQSLGTSENDDALSCHSRESGNPVLSMDQAFI